MTPARRGDGDLPIRHGFGRHLPVIACALLVVLAGCAGTGVPPSTSPGSDATATGTATGVTPAATSTSTVATTPSTPSTPVPTVTEPPAADNPWRRTPIVVGVRDTTNSGRNYTRLVRAAVDYWRTTGRNFTAYEPAFSVRADASTPDLVVTILSKVPYCNGRYGDDIVGCAPVLHRTDPVGNHVTVEIQGGLANTSTYEVMRHEFGHVLGLAHDEGPDHVMSPRSDVYKRLNRVAVDYAADADAYHRRRSDAQVGHALDYYASGADGFLDADVTFARVQNASDADIVVNVTDRGRDRSTATLTDGRYVITVDDIPLEHRGWHVGYWLGFYFGANTTRDLPPPFDVPDGDPRSDWW